ANDLGEAVEPRVALVDAIQARLDDRAGREVPPDHRGRNRGCAEFLQGNHSPQRNTGAISVRSSSGNSRTPRAWLMSRLKLRITSGRCAGRISNASNRAVASMYSSIIRASIIADTCSALAGDDRYRSAPVRALMLRAAGNEQVGAPQCGGDHPAYQGSG